MKLSPHFDSSEFACHCGCGFGNSVGDVNPQLLTVLEVLRIHFATPVQIVSGCRCRDHNAAVGGAEKSEHLHGLAADIKLAGITPKKIAAFAETLLPQRGGIGIYTSWTHVDVRPGMARWSG